jgi:carboxymethylenebutenolidase
MCFGPHSRPPIPPIAGAAVAHQHLELDASDGTRLAAFRADASEPSGTGIIVLPDVRGLFPYYEELALRFAEVGVDALAIDYFGRTAGASPRDADFDFGAHVPRTTWAGLQADVRAAAAALREARGVRRIYSIGFCFGGRLSLLLDSLPDLALDGVIAFYGWPLGPSRNDTPAPLDVVDRCRAPVLAIFGGADKGIPPEHVAAFEAALEREGVPHRVITYEGAPHSFFDRAQDVYAEDSRAAWQAVLEFIGRA